MAMLSAPGPENFASLWTRFEVYCTVRPCPLHYSRIMGNTRYEPAGRLKAEELNCSLGLGEEKELRIRTCDIALASGSVCSMDLLEDKGSNLHKGHRSKVTIVLN